MAADAGTVGQCPQPLAVSPQNIGGPAGSGVAAPAPGGFRHGMRALRRRDFRIFFAGAVVSNTGNWLQTLAVPYVLFQLTGSGFWVGLATFSQFIPTMLLGPYAGSLADRADRRTVLLIGQSLMALAAGTLWLVWTLGVARAIGDRRGDCAHRRLPGRVDPVLAGVDPRARAPRRAGVGDHAQLDPVQRVAARSALRSRAFSSPRSAPDGRSASTRCRSCR